MINTGKRKKDGFLPQGGTSSMANVLVSRRRKWPCNEASASRRSALLVGYENCSLFRVLFEHGFKPFGVFLCCITKAICQMY